MRTNLSNFLNASHTSAAEDALVLFHIIVTLWSKDDGSVERCLGA